MKKLFFTNNRSQKLAGVLHEAGSKKAVIMAHGFTADKDEEGIFVRCAETLCKEGFTVLRFDFAGSGESEGEFSEMTLSGEAEDLKSAFGFVKRNGYEKIGLIAASFGGAVAIIAHPDADVVVLWNPRTKGGFATLDKANRDWRKHIERDGYFEFYKENRKRLFRVGRPLVEEMDSIDILAETRKIKSPLLVIHGGKDSLIPLADSAELMKILKGPKKLEVLKGAEHGFHDPASEKIAIKLTLDWFKKYL